MEQVLQLNRVKEMPKKGEKVIILELTDIQLHSNVLPTESIGNAVQRSIKNKKPGRIFSTLNKIRESGTDQNSIVFEVALAVNDPKLKQVVQDYQQQGYRVLIQKPKAGLPIYLGKDAEEFINSTRGRRILRKIRKDKE